MYRQSMFWAKIRKNIKAILLKISIFYTLGKTCILHWHVFVMSILTWRKSRSQSEDSSLANTSSNLICSPV